MHVGLRRAAGPLASRLFGSSSFRCAGSWATVDPGALSGSKPGKAQNCGEHAAANAALDAVCTSVQEPSLFDLVMCWCKPSSTHE